MDFLTDRKPIAPSPYPPSHITPTSPFLPHNRHCPIGSPQPAAEPAEPCACLPHYSLPVSWLCGTCGAANSVLEMLLQTQQHQQQQPQQQRRIASERCASSTCCCCERPSLRAVYDQFGRIFLCWRDDDPAVSDLRDSDKVREAARRMWQVGGGQVLDLGMGMEAGVGIEAGGVRDGDDGEMEGDDGPARKRWTRLSQSSVTSEDSFDAELAAMEE
ncbi:hypothetical protein MMYC01_207808 [Madurella mycetomatis]|uniref:Uncharacterized protein n=1 Tax=Madurella mycetomatis TaxID=100816 RepID=A0A175VWV1_9PEZI|nr:hypothetical protein MMYC01_207808 [Madurella mycetomatis]